MSPIAIRRALAILLLSCAWPGAAAAQRLPETVVPVHYTIAWTPDLAAATFTGQTTIDVTVPRPTDRIVLNAADLDISHAEVRSGGQTIVPSISADAAREQLTLQLPSALQPGTAQLSFTYSAALNDKLRGLYISRSPRRAYAATQFESTDARRAFPCFDEPAYKATFDVSATVAAGDIAISNGPVASDQPAPGGRHTVTFKTTKKMSTYLVALAVGDFTCSDGQADDIPIRICAIPEKVSLTRFGLEAAERIVPFFNTYYGIRYPFEKLDVVALPDFAAGAMENTAAIFYRESMLLVDERSSSPETLKSVAGVLSHEIAHQWFGDLVTMRWWDDVWLNEGFATWATNKPLEGWRGWSFAGDDAQELLTAMRADALPSTRPIYLASDDPKVIEESFDESITYYKSASVLRMIEHFVGPEVFQRGVGAYLQAFSYGNATSKDFWNTIARVSGTPVDRIMPSFVLQAGVPEIQVDGQCTNGATRLTLRQDRFVETGRAAVPDTTRWSVPVCIERPGAGGRTCTVLDKPSGAVTLPGCTPWIFANDNGTGYYRTRYAPDLLSAVRQSGFDALSPIERNMLVADQWAFTRTGDVRLGDYLSLADAALRHPERASLSTVTGALDFVDDYLTAEPERGPWQAWVKARVQPIVDRMGWTPRPGDTADDIEMRGLAIHLMGTVVNDPAVRREALARVRADLAGTNPIPPSIATIAYDIAARAGDAALYEEIRRSLVPSLPPVVFYRRQRALAAFTDPALVRRTIEYAISPDVRSQDAPFLLARLVAEPRNTPTAWPIIKERWSDIRRKIDIAAGLNAVVRSLAFCSPGDRQDVQAFFDAHPVPEAAQSLSRGLERIDACIATRAAQAGALAPALAFSARR